jgi:very-long-chain (3R)-3-hydroxyacyl-CoA dehydratase
MQVASRILLVWGITYPFPHVASSPAYTSMLLAWSVTEVIRYSYFGAAHAGGGVPPDSLLWLRYNTFYVLYPVGILSEVALIVAALEPAGAVREELKWVLYAILGIYAPCKFLSAFFSGLRG